MVRLALEVTNAAKAIGCRAVEGGLSIGIVKGIGRVVPAAAENKAAATTASIDAPFPHVPRQVKDAEPIHAFAFSYRQQRFGGEVA